MLANGHLTKIGRIALLLVLAISLVCGSAIGVSAAPITFQGTECITRQEGTSVTITIVPNANITNLIYDYDKDASGTPYAYSTTSTTASNGTPKSVVISGLTANTKYYYRMRYSTDGGGTYETRAEKTFWTARATGSTFTFDVTSDNHVNIVMGSATTWQNTLNDVAADAPDFLLDLGDTVAIRGLNPGDTAGATSAYTYTLKFFNTVSASSGVYLVPGNHEQKERWHVDGTPNDAGDPVDSLPIIGTKVQKQYYPMPIPDSFYTGDSTLEPLLGGDQLKQSYYSWTWGDALFVVLDPFWYTLNKPYVNDQGGGETNGTGTGDAWTWTLGQTQFNWMKNTLTNSTAKYKFVFAHQLPMDASLSNQEDYGHAGANHTIFTEMGGYDEDGTTYSWSTKRAGWGADPIHTIFKNTKVSCVFHGHDHQYAYEIRDGVVYQAVPAGGWGDGQNGFGMYTTGDGYTIRALPNAGHLKVTFAPAQTTVQYYRVGTTTPTTNGTYTIAPGTPPTSVLGDVNNDGQANSTDALIVLSGDVGIDISSFCPVNCGDVNADGVVNSTDALIILSFDAGMSVPFPVETGACPGTVTQPSGCS